MNKWLGNDDTDSSGEQDAGHRESPEPSTGDSVRKWFADPAAPTEETAPSTGATETTDEVQPSPSVPSYLTADAVTTDEATVHPAAAESTRAKRKARKKNKPRKAKAGTSRPARSSRPARPKRSLPHVPRWAKITGVAVLSVGVIGAAAKVGADRFSSNDTPVLAGDHAADLVTDPTQTPTATSVEPTEEGTGWTDRGDLPYESTPVVSGQCDPGDGEERIRPSSKSLRSTVATFYNEYRAHNAKGIGATLDKESSMKDQNWGAVFDQLDPDATWCVRMEADEGTRVDIQVRMNVDGSDTVFEQTATGTQTDGQWKILELEERK